MTVCVRMRGDASQVKQCVPCRGKDFEMFKNVFQGVTHDAGYHGIGDDPDKNLGVSTSQGRMQGGCLGCQNTPLS